jgi:hypothetical protein
MAVVIKKRDIPMTRVLCSGMNQSTKAIASFDQTTEANSISQCEWLVGCFLWPCEF